MLIRKILVINKNKEDKKEVEENLIKLLWYNKLTFRKIFWILLINFERWFLYLQILLKVITSKIIKNEIYKFIGLFLAL